MKRQTLTTSSDDKIEIPKWAIRMLTFDGYSARFYHHLAVMDCTHPVAWQKTEDEFQSFFQISRYESYESFKKMIKYFKKKSLK